jgi:DNA-binding winged helix-turn-helix (wHTH) protein
MDDIAHRILRFEHFALDLARGSLRTGDQEIHLRPKTFEVLHCLAQNAGRLVLKQELFETVWPKVAVCDDSLVQCIRELRQKLGDDERRLIKTVSRRGYLLDAPILAQPSQWSAGSAVTPAEGPQKPATKFDALHRALRTIAAHKLRMRSAAAASICIALGVIYLLSLPVLSADPGFLSLAKTAPEFCIQSASSSKPLL